MMAPATGGAAVAGGRGVAVGGGLGVALGVAVAVGIAVGVCVGVSVGSGVDVAVAVGATVAVFVGVGDGVKVAVGVGFAVFVAVGCGVGVAVGVTVAVFVGVGDGLKVAVGVSVGNSVAVAVGGGSVAVDVAVAVLVAVGNGLGVVLGVRVGGSVAVAVVVGVAVGRGVSVGVAVGATVAVLMTVGNGVEVALGVRVGGALAASAVVALATSVTVGVSGNCWVTEIAAMPAEISWTGGCVNVTVANGEDIAVGDGEIAVVGVRVRSPMPEFAIPLCVGNLSTQRRQGTLEEVLMRPAAIARTNRTLTLHMTNPVTRRDRNCWMGLGESVGKILVLWRNKAARISAMLLNRSLASICMARKITFSVLRLICGLIWRGGRSKLLGSGGLWPVRSA